MKNQNTNRLTPNQGNGRIRVAIQKSGRLSDRSQEVLKNLGLRFARSKDKLFWYGQDFPVDLLLVRDDDIPRLLLEGVCELGMVGENIAQEVMRENGGQGLDELRVLNFGRCRLSARYGHIDFRPRFDLQPSASTASKGTAKCPKARTLQPPRDDCSGPR